MDSFHRLLSQNKYFFILHRTWEIPDQYFSIALNELDDKGVRHIFSQLHAIYGFEHL